MQYSKLDELLAHLVNRHRASIVLVAALRVHKFGHEIVFPAIARRARRWRGREVVSVKIEFGRRLAIARGAFAGHGDIWSW